MTDYTQRLRENTVPGAADIFPSTAPVIVPRRETVDAAALKDALVKAEGGDYRFRGFRLTRTALEITGEVTDDDWRDLGKVLTGLQGRIQWLIGDWVTSVQKQWGDTYEQIAAWLDYEAKTIREWSYVCQHVDPSIRMDNLTFGHHQVVASLSPDQQVEWLWRAASEGMSVALMRRRISQALPKSDKRSPSPIGLEQLDLLRDVRNVLKNERNLDKVTARSLRIYAMELQQLVQKMQALADEKEQR